MLNKVTLQGRLTKDPEVRSTQSQTPFCSFTLAVERSFKDANGQRATDFINCTAWRNSATLLGQYFHKGDMLIVTGSLQVRKYDDQNGQTRYVTEVLVEEINFCGGNSQTKPAGQPAAPAVEQEFYDDNDEMPFEI